MSFRVLEQQLSAARCHSASARILCKLYLHGMCRDRRASAILRMCALKQTPQACKTSPWRSVMFLVLSADRAMGAAPIARSALRTRNITLLHGDAHPQRTCYSRIWRRRHDVCACNTTLFQVENHEKKERKKEIGKNKVSFRI